MRKKLLKTIIETLDKKLKYNPIFIMLYTLNKIKQIYVSTTVLTISFLSNLKAFIILKILKSTLLKHDTCRPVIT